MKKFVFDKTFFEHSFSFARMKPYFDRYSGNEKKAIRHYKQNIQLAESLLPSLSVYVENIYAMTRIENEMQYDAVMQRINELLEVVNENTPEDDVRSVELVSLSNLVADYEDERYVLGCN